MAEPRRERILASLTSKFAGMTGTRFWGGKYNNDPIVTRILRTPDQVNQFPYVCVQEGTGAALSLDVPETGTDGTYVHHFPVNVWGYVRGDSTITRSTWLQRLADDVRREVLKDRQLGVFPNNLCEDITFGEEETDEGLLEPIGAFRLGLIVLAYETLPVS